MIKIMLINHVARPEEINEPLGIEVLSGQIYADFSGLVETRLFFIHSPEEQRELQNTMESYRPHLIGISSKKNKVDAMLETYMHASRLDPKPLVMIGDQLSTLASDEVLKIAPTAICVRGEGEGALNGVVKELLRKRKDNLSFEALSREVLEKDIPNCALIRDGNLHRTTGRMVDVSTAAPPDRAFINRAVSEGWIIHAEASRGCPWSRCSFCYINQKYHGLQPWRPMPIDSVIFDLEVLSSAGTNIVWYTDEDFVGPDLDRIWKLGEAIIEAKAIGRINPTMAFFVSSSAKTILRHDKILKDSGGAPKLLRHLHKAGVKELFLGIESGCNSQLQRYDKGISADANIKAINIVRESGIELDLGFIPFDPWTTLDELEGNLDFLRRANLIHQPVRLMKNILITPGTPLANRYAKEHPETHIDLNELTLDYKFHDERVALIAELVKRRWSVNSSAIYRLQTTRRVVSPTEPEREVATKRLCEARTDDYEFVNNCVQAAKKQSEDWYNAIMEVDTVSQSALS